MANTEYDVVIVGAGISGALIANELAGQGAKVLILEAGDTPPTHQSNIDDFYANPIKTPGAPYPPTKDAPRPDVPLDGEWKNPNAFPNDPRYYFVQTGADAFGSTYERITGGTTQHWLGTAMRMLPEDFETKSKFGFADDWPISYDDLEPWYTEAENQIGVAGDAAVDAGLGAPHSGDYPMEPVPISWSDQVLKKKWDGISIDGKKISVDPTPQARNTKFYDNRPICMGNTSCVPICPIDAKYRAHVHIKKALNQKTPATLRTKSVVHRVDIDPSSGDVGGIVYKNRDGTEHTVRARRYVMAANAIETAKILLMSPWKDVSGETVHAANSSGLVGKRLMDHICLVAWGLSDEPLHPYRGPLSTSGIGAFRHGDFRSESAAFRIELGNEGWNWPTGAPDTLVAEMVQKQGLLGSKLKDALAENSIRQFRMALELEATPLDSSYIVPSTTHKDQFGIPRPELHYAISDDSVPNGDYTVKGYANADKVYPRLFEAAGIKNFTAIPKDDAQPGVFNYNGARYQFRGAGHVIGTYLMGDDPSKSVVDKLQRSWDHKNLFLVGSGAFPTTGTANPTLTIAALALWAARTINDDLQKTG